MAYNPYSDIESIYNLKGEWDNAYKKGDTEATKKIAAQAQAYYDKLKNNKFGGVAQALTASNYTEAKKILDAYKPEVSSAEMANKNTTEVNQKVNQLWGTQTDDRTAMAGKYDKLEETAYSNPFESAEAKAILAKYDLAGLQGRDNAIASGGASNGGNIDSYAAANAMRQQTALTNQGQMAVLEAHNNKLNNVKGILESLGVYQQNQDKGMQETIGIQQTEAQRLFENDETAKNNDVARKSEIAKVTGYAPDEWVVSNNPYMNEDGTIKDQYKDIDFSAVMAEAKKAGNTATYNAAATARFYKIMSDYAQYGQYDDGNYTIPGQQETEARREFDEQIAASDRALNAEVGINEKKVDAELKMNEANNKNTLDQINANADVAKEMLELQQLYSGGGTNKFTEEQTKKVDEVVDALNKILKQHSSNPNHTEPIVGPTDGKYKFVDPRDSTKLNADGWTDVIVNYVHSTTLTDKEKGMLYLQLELDPDDVDKVYKRNGWDKE